MVAIEPARVTTLTYVHENGHEVFSGIVDTTNLEIFRDFLTLLPVDRDLVVSIAALEIRVPEAAMLLVERCRSLRWGRLILSAG